MPEEQETQELAIPEPEMDTETGLEEPEQPEAPDDGGDGLAQAKVGGTPETDVPEASAPDMFIAESREAEAASSDDFAEADKSAEPPVVEKSPETADPPLETESDMEADWPEDDAQFKTYGGELPAGEDSSFEEEPGDAVQDSQAEAGGATEETPEEEPIPEEPAALPAEASDESPAVEESPAPEEAEAAPKAPRRRTRKKAEESSRQPEEESTSRARRRNSASAEPAQDPAADQPAPSRRRRASEPARPQVLAIGDESKVQSAEDKEAYLWMELRGSMRTKRPLTGVLGGVERTPTGVPLAIVYYKDMRIVIPASEMNINLADHGESSEKDLNNRYAQILSWMMGAEIEFTVSGLDKRAGSVVASRRDAMQRKQRHFFLTPARNGQPLVQEGITAEARVVAVSERVVRVEVFGVETPIFAREVAWEWVDDCNDYFGIGDRVLVKILSIDRSDPRNIRLRASIRETAPIPARENIQKCVVQGKYIGKVSDVDRNAIYVRLNVGVNAIALAVHDRRTPSRKDDVSFVVTRIDEDAGIAIGIITRIIKQYL